MGDKQISVALTELGEHEHTPLRDAVDAALQVMCEASTGARKRGSAGFWVITPDFGA
jgi:hypothetical protein